MDWMRIRAVYQRYFYNLIRLEQLSELFYWPAMDICLWGIAMVWIQKMEPGQSLALPILTAIVFWQIIWRSNYEVSVNVLQEFWSRNFVNLFSTPLKVSEWIASLMLLGITKILITVAYGAFLVVLLYSLNIFSMGWAFLPFSASLIMSGWFCGFLSASIIIYFGQRVQMIAFMAGFLFAPFSAVFYPLKALPEWVQPISRALPMTYIFEGMREVLNNKVFSLKMFAISIALNIFYLGLALLFFKFMFEKSREKGLARLE